MPLNGKQGKCIDTCNFRAAEMLVGVPPNPLDFWTPWCAPRQVDSEIIYILRMKILPAYHMVLGAMQPVDGHGLP